MRPTVLSRRMRLKSSFVLWLLWVELSCIAQAVGAVVGGGAIALCSSLAFARFCARRGAGSFSGGTIGSSYSPSSVAFGPVRFHPLCCSAHQLPPFSSPQDGTDPTSSSSSPPPPPPPPPPFSASISSDQPLLIGSTPSHSPQRRAWRHPQPVNDMIYRQDYVVCYNRATRNAHWTFQHMTKNDSKITFPRDGMRFREDKEIPHQYRSTLNDYMKSGYDRGHLVPCADISSTEDSLDETFILSNISPQVAVGFNRDYWAYLERFVRSLKDKYDHVYVYTGPLFLPEKHSKDGTWRMNYRVLGNDQPTVSVPTHFFKVIMAENEDGSSSKASNPPLLLHHHQRLGGGARPSKPRRVLGGFILPNRVIAADEPLESFARPLPEISRLAGMTFFEDLIPENEAAAADASTADTPTPPKDKTYVPLCDEVKCRIPTRFTRSAWKAKRKAFRESWTGNPEAPAHLVREFDSSSSSSSSSSGSGSYDSSSSSSSSMTSSRDDDEYDQDTITPNTKNRNVQDQMIHNAPLIGGGNAHPRPIERELPVVQSTEEFTHLNFALKRMEEDYARRYREADPRVLAALIQQIDQAGDELPPRNL